MVDFAPPLSLLAAQAGSPAFVDAMEQLQRCGGVLGLAPPQELPDLRQALGQGDPLMWRHAPAVVLGSGGSSGRRRWCLQPLTHLEASAAATGDWLRQLGIEPSTALVVNPLPWHHVSGLMPWFRSQIWGAEHRWLEPAQLRTPQALPHILPLPPGQPTLLSLVPTQLHRLLAHPAGVRWLQGFSLIWIGGAPLAPEERGRSRQLGLHLAPCYGSTETGSMVTALAPQAFLAGQAGCGRALPHAQLRIAPANGAVEVRSRSLSPGVLEGGRLWPLAKADGWWRSGDMGQLAAEGGLTLLGRLDGAVHSGGETVFPEQVELALQTLAAQQGLPLAALLLVAQPDPEWGQRLVALVRGQGGEDATRLIPALQRLAAGLPPAQRPRDWRLCPELEPNAMGKWERQHWQRWLSDQS
ncbi:MAG: O-succinylbenzoic acid-CoA ligase [Cyanobacteriota bacterium]|jgi:O-succinylbenzoic acid--CoA ligase